MQAKLARHESIEKIADDLVESVEVIRQIVKKLDYANGDSRLIEND